MKLWFLKACYFLHITDGHGQLDLTDLSFAAIVIKMILAPNFDWGAVCAMIPVLASQMHSNHIEYLSKRGENEIHNIKP